MQNMKLEFVKEQLPNEKLKCELQKVVSSVELLISESEDEFKQFQKSGLYKVKFRGQKRAYWKDI